MMYNDEDDDDIIHDTPDPVSDTPPIVEESGDVATEVSPPIEEADPVSDTTIDLRGEKRETLIDLMDQEETLIGAAELDKRTQRIGSWENLVFRAITDPNYEEIRIQNAIAALKTEDRATMSHILRNEEGKVVLRTSARQELSAGAGETVSLTGTDALLAWECQDKGGGYRLPLYNSGISVDLIVPTGNDFQTLLYNCLIVDRELGSRSGAHYFTYSDVMFKTQVWNFLRPLIVHSSYIDWQKGDALANIIKLPDLAALVMTLAALCYKKGFDGFRSKCSRPITPEHPTGCQHVEQIHADLFKMITTRWSSMSKPAVDHMVSTRKPNARHSLTQIAKYQADLGFEGEKIVFGGVTFTMRIPSLAEHFEAGNAFLSEIINEIEGDNAEGRYQQVGLRYIRTFIPWIASVEKSNSAGGIIRSVEPAIIVRALEKADDDDKTGEVRDRLREYIDQSQLTYVGYPVTACPACGHSAETPSGLWTFDPFSAFFTLASLLVIQTS